MVGEVVALVHREVGHLRGASYHPATMKTRESGLEDRRSNRLRAWGRKADGARRSGSERPCSCTKDGTHRRSLVPLLDLILNVLVLNVRLVR